jgi:hypothetical protein
MQAISETSVRRLAARMGYSVMKSRTRDENRLDHGGFMLIDVRNNAAVIGAHPFAYSASLEEIEAWLREGHRTATAGHQPAGSKSRVRRPFAVES